MVRAGRAHPVDLRRGLAAARRSASRVLRHRPDPDRARAEQVPEGAGKLCGWPYPQTFKNRTANALSVRPKPDRCRAASRGPRTDQTADDQEQRARFGHGARGHRVTDQPERPGRDVGVSHPRSAVYALRTSEYRSCGLPPHSPDVSRAEDRKKVITWRQFKVRWYREQSIGCGEERQIVIARDRNE